MLSRPGSDFRGGAFQTVEPSGAVRAHRFDIGDAIVVRRSYWLEHPRASIQPCCEPCASWASRHAPVALPSSSQFVSHKPHFVAPVTSGERAVLIAELWEGEERTCPHRCEVRDGACFATPTRRKA